MAIEGGLLVFKILERESFLELHDPYKIYVQYLNQFSLLAVFNFNISQWEMTENLEACRRSAKEGLQRYKYVISLPDLRIKLLIFTVQSAYYSLNFNKFVILVGLLV